MKESLETKMFKTITLRNHETLRCHEFSKDIDILLVNRKKRFCENLSLTTSK